MALHSLTGLAKGKDIDEIVDADYWSDFFNPASPGFLRTDLFGIRFGLSPLERTTITAAVRTFKEIDREAKTGDFDAGALIDPTVSWWRGKAAPLIGMGIDLVSGEEFDGKKLKTAIDYALEIRKAAIPSVAQEFFQGDARDMPGYGDVRGLIYYPLSVLGLASSKIPAYQVADALQEAEAKDQFDKKWDELDYWEQWQVRKSNPEIEQFERDALRQGIDKGQDTSLFWFAVQENRDKILVEAGQYKEYAEQGYRPRDASKPIDTNKSSEDGNWTPYSWTDYRNDMYAVERKMAEVPEILKANPGFADVPITDEEYRAKYGERDKTTLPDNMFVEAWYDTLDKSKIGDSTDALDYDKLETLRNELVASSDPVVVAKAMMYLNRNKLPALVQAREAYQAYRELPKYRNMTVEEGDAVDRYNALVNQFEAGGNSTKEARAKAAIQEPVGAKLRTKHRTTDPARKKYLYVNGRNSDSGLTPEGELIYKFYRDMPETAFADDGEQTVDTQE